MKNIPEVLWVGAVRYYLGRMSYGVHEICTELELNWDTIPNSTKEVIIHDVEGALSKNQVGMQMDREDWEDVTKLWRNK